MREQQLDRLVVARLDGRGAAASRPVLMTRTSELPSVRPRSPGSERIGGCCLSRMFTLAPRSSSIPAMSSPVCGVERRQIAAAAIRDLIELDGDV